jgi:hypothetical protein
LGGLAFTMVAPRCHANQSGAHNAT